jgi:hypothetical protein
MARKYIKHGHTNNPLWETYRTMLKRCYSINFKDYVNYGARGIQVNSNWLGINGFNNFFKDMGNKPSTEHTLDRVDVNGNYSLDNCRWATRKTQQNNRRNTIYVSYHGKQYKFQELLDKSNLKRYQVEIRISRGWTIEDAFDKPIRHQLNNKVNFNQKIL